MSYYAEETYDVYVETRVTARKEHRCNACDERIAPGTSYWRVRCVYDGAVESHKRCTRCQAIHVHLRVKCGTWGDSTWPDERLACGRTYEDEWGELPAEVAALAFALPGERLDQLAMRAEGVDHA